jgi:hypothetical protein
MMSRSMTLVMGLHASNFLHSLRDWRYNVDKRLVHFTKTRSTQNIDWDTDIKLVNGYLETQIEMVKKQTGRPADWGGP